MDELTSCAVLMAKKKHDVNGKGTSELIWGAKKEDGSVDCVGCVANGVSEQVANEIFDEMSSFASYALISRTQQLMRLSLTVPHT